MDLNTCKLDAGKLSGGVWWLLSRQPDGTLSAVASRGEHEDRPAVLVCPIGVEYERALEEARRPYLLEIRDRRLLPADERAILAQAVAQTLWKGARNLTVGGQPLVYRVAEAAQMLAKPEWTNLLECILRIAQDRAALLADEEARAAGN
jgi:hypothetical protein